ncbi:carbohydrate-binding domain-containing protein [Eubacteriales bacterium OttesenSCG-928-N13]|nr:carbohydrate-binding domain-containing protein [Eubacteriales bacterium OttesenSCG-928-N13]
MKRRMILVVMLMLALTLALTTGAQAATTVPIDLATLGADYTISDSRTYQVTGSSESHVIKVTNGKPTIILQNMRINSRDASPIHIEGGSTEVTLKLSGTNSLYTSGADMPALAVENGAKLTIANKDSKDAGRLSVYQDQYNPSSVSSGVIGGRTHGTITFKSGEINAQLLSGTANMMSVIGGGYDMNTGYTINLAGGNVTVSSPWIEEGDDPYWAAGIGSGPYVTTNINISGGTITAYSSGNSTNQGAAIGSGSGGNANINITGGIIENASSYDGAAIGSGSDGNATINISGGTVYYAQGFNGAGIGSGVRGHASIEIKNGFISYIFGINSACIGAGVDGNAVVTITGGHFDNLNSEYDDGMISKSIDGVIGRYNQDATAKVTIKGTKMKQYSPFSLKANEIVLDKALVPMLYRLDCDKLTLIGKNTIQKVSGFHTPTYSPIYLNTLNAGSSDYIVLEDYYGEFMPDDVVAEYPFTGSQLRKGSSFSYSSMELLYESGGVRVISNAAEAMLLVKGKLKGVYSVDNALNIINNDPSITNKTKPSQVVIKLLNHATISQPIKKPCTITGRGFNYTLSSVDGKLHVQNNLALNMLVVGNDEMDEILLEAPGVTLATKLVLVNGSIIETNVQPSATLSVNSRLDVNAVKVNTMKLNKAYFYLGMGILDIQKPIALSGTSRLSWDIDVNAGPILRTNSRTLTSGSGTLKLDEWSWNDVGLNYILAINSGTKLTSLGRAKLPSHWNKYKVAFGTDNATLVYKVGAVSLTKGKKTTGYATFDEALTAINGASGCTIKLNQPATTTATTLPPSLTIDGQEEEFDLDFENNISIPDQSLTLKNLESNSAVTITCGQLTLIGSYTSLSVNTKKMIISGYSSLNSLSVSHELKLNNKAFLYTDTSILNTAAANGTLKLALSGSSGTSMPWIGSDPIIPLIKTNGSAAKLQLTGSGKLFIENSYSAKEYYTLIENCNIVNGAAVMKQIKLGEGFEDYWLELTGNQLNARHYYTID